LDWIYGFQLALSYIESRLDGEIDCARAAELAQSDEYHFQRAFSMLTGITLTDYIRMRRLTLAATELKRGAKVIDVALMYGYSSPESFARAFSRFHGVPPSEARKPSIRLNSCSPLHVKLTLEGGSMLDYRIEHKPGMKLLGFHRRFEGAPFGRNRDHQEGALFTSTRAHQWMLRGLSDDSDSSDVVAITDVTDSGYACWYCCKPDAYSLEHLYDASITGIDFMERFGFEMLSVPAGDYAVFSTARSRYPVADYCRLREQISTEWLPGSGYTLRNAPELAIYHWYTGAQRESRFIEIWIPVT